MSLLRCYDQRVDTLRSTLADTVLNKSPFATFTPYELYLKFLYEYFRTELNRPFTH